MAISAAAVNPVDVLLIAGMLPFAIPLPCIPGFEAAGEVVECGSGVQSLKKGSRVAITLVGRGFAEEITVPAANVMPIPDNMDFTTAAAFVVPHGTAHVGLVHRAGLRSGDTLLVHGAAGNVASAAVQIGKRLGATVIATCGANKKQDVLAKGADHVIDYQKEDIAKRVLAITRDKGADVVFDTVGGDAFDASLKCMRREGRIVFVGMAGGRNPTVSGLDLLSKGVSVIGVDFAGCTLYDVGTVNRALTEVLGWYAEGRIKPNPAKTMPLEQAVDALVAVATGKAGGKLVLTPGKPL